MLYCQGLLIYGTSRNITSFHEKLALQEEKDNYQGLLVTECKFVSKTDLSMNLLIIMSVVNYRRSMFIGNDVMTLLKKYDC